jgi:hypothetical protein
MDGACSMYVGEEMRTGFGRECRKKEVTWTTLA